MRSHARDVIFCSLLSACTFVTPSFTLADDFQENCATDFAKVAVSALRTRAVPQKISTEVRETIETVNAIRALQKRSHYKFWTAEPDERARFFRDALASKSVSRKIADEFAQLIKDIESTDSKTQAAIYHLLSLPDDHAVATFTRVLRQKKQNGREIAKLRLLVEVTAEKQCIPITHACEAKVLRDLLGSDRRPITQTDLANRLESDPKKNFQILQSTRMTDAEAKVVSNYLKFASDVTIDSNGVVTAAHPLNHSPPVELQNYFDGLLTELHELDPLASISKIELLNVKKGAARTPTTHPDGGPAIQVLAGFQGEKTWVQAADGKYIQVSAHGDSLLFLTTGTNHPTLHVSPMDFISDRTMFRIQVKSPKFAKKPN